MHFLARLHAAFDRHRTFVGRDRILAELAHAQQRAFRAQLAAAVEHHVVFERLGVKTLAAEIVQLALQSRAIVELEFDFDFGRHDSKDER